MHLFSTGYVPRKGNPIDLRLDIKDPQWQLGISQLTAMVQAGEIQRLEIVGTEPLIDTGLQTWLLEIGASTTRQIHLRLTTDCMHWDDDWSRTLSRFTTCTVSAVVQNFNIGRLGEIMDRCRNLRIGLTPVLLTDPDCLHITNLPYPALGWAANNVLGWIPATPEPHLREFLGRCFTLLIRAEFDEARWQRFLTQVELIHGQRGTDWRQWIPAS